MLALVIAPVEPLTKSTWGIDTKFVPVIVIVVAVAGAIVCDTFATVGDTGCGTSAKDKLPEPSVFKKYPLVILCGKVKV